MDDLRSRLRHQQIGAFGAVPHRRAEFRQRLPRDGDDRVIPGHQMTIHIVRPVGHENSDANRTPLGRPAGVTPPVPLGAPIGSLGGYPQRCTPVLRACARALNNALTNSGKLGAIPGQQQISQRSSLVTGA